MSDSDGQFEVTVIKLLLLIYYGSVIQAEGYFFVIFLVSPGKCWGQLTA